jgi:hypothetical protein
MLLFLLDLLCLKEGEQREVVQTHFLLQSKGEERGYCENDVFYCICMKYELPLFEFVRLLKQ